MMNALKAKEFYRRDVQYIVRNGKALIINEVTPFHLSMFVVQSLPVFSFLFLLFIVNNCLCNDFVATTTMWLGPMLVLTNWLKKGLTEWTFCTCCWWRIIIFNIYFSFSFQFILLSCHLFLTGLDLSSLTAFSKNSLLCTRD